MREIKFRAWDKKEKCFIASGNIFLSGDGELYHGWDKEQVDIQLFTGLKDKNGKEIYEGDILQIFTPKGVEAYTEVVDDIFKAHNLRGVGDYFGSCEVIGNKYENHELINQDE